MRKLIVIGGITDEMKKQISSMFRDDDLDLVHLAAKTTIYNTTNELVKAVKKALESCECGTGDAAVITVTDPGLMIAWLCELQWLGVTVVYSVFSNVVSIDPDTQQPRAFRNHIRFQEFPMVAY